VITTIKSKNLIPRTTKNMEGRQSVPNEELLKEIEELKRQNEELKNENEKARRVIWIV
jgi:hypothetical protein